VVVEGQEEGVVDVERWAELRREHFVRGVSIKELMRRTGLARNTIRAALRSPVPPDFKCPERRSKLDPFKDEIHVLLRGDPKLTGVRIRELIEPLGFAGGKSIVDDYLREVRPLFLVARTFQRTIYRPGEMPVRSVAAGSRDPCWSRPDQAGLCCRCLPRLLALWRRRARVLQGGRGSAVGDRALFVVVRRVAVDAGLGP
jgi:hypothetical protein